MLQSRSRIVRLLGTGRLADVVSDLLSDSGLVVVSGDPRLAVALAARDREVAIAGERSAKVELRSLQFDDLGHLPDLEAGAAAAAVIANAARDEAGHTRLAGLARAVARGGVVVLIDKVTRVKSSHAALIAGLSRLEQRVVSRTVVTAGVVG